MTIEADLLEILPKRFPKCRLKELVEYIEDIEPDFPNIPHLDEVEVSGARCAVGKTEAYGLELDLDANGNATSVRFPYGAFVA